MKSIALLILIAFLTFPGRLYGQGSQSNAYSIDVEAIRLNPPLMSNAATQQEFDAFAERIPLCITPTEGGGYNPPLLAEIVAFITAHPSDQAALSAKFYLGQFLYCAREKYRVEEKDEIFAAMTRDIATICHTIVEESPDSWQGKLAAHFTGDFLMPPDEAVFVANLMAQLSTWLEIQDEPGFLQFFQRQGYTDPVEVVVRGMRILFAIEDEKNPVKAEEELARLKERYPDLQKTKELEQHIEWAYADQFDGGLHSIPENEILRLFTTSLDVLEVKQAAAALGNLAIWKTLRIPKGGADIITNAVIGDIDRALSGDETERETMIDLIYRLWQLAVPALLETLDHENPDRVAFAGERLLYMRNEEIITAMIAKARAAVDETKKAQLVGLLARMNEPCTSVMRFRECLPAEELHALYQRLVAPALAELTSVTPTP